MKNYAFIYNPAARGGQSDSKLSVLEQKILQVPNARLFRSEKKGDISELVDQLKPTVDVFIACGGDGTVREIASKLISVDKSMGIIPMGTGNDLCKTLKIPTNLEKSFEMILQDQSIMMDVGQCNEWTFLNSLGFGFDGLANRFASEAGEFIPFVRYAIAALKAAVFQEPFGVQIKNKENTSEEQLIMVTVANGRVEGGTFWIAPEAVVNDGKLNLITINPLRKWLIPFLLPMFLIRKPGLIPQLKSRKVKEVELSFKNKVEIHADGEIIQSDMRKFKITLISNALEVICGL